MGRFRTSGGGRWGLRLATAAVFVLVVGLAAWGADGKAQGKKAGGGAAAKKAARKEAKAKEAKAEKAEKKPEQPEKPSGIPLPPRPVKTVGKPSLNPVALDALVAKFLSESKVPLAAATYDIEFVRRVYLDLTGKLPTPEQTHGFLATGGHEKRGKLIEYLLNSEDYARNWARYWRDVIRFRSTQNNGNRVRYDELEDWLTAQLAKNRPWDEIAHDVITATGQDDENGAVNFALAHDAQPVELAGEVSRVFLGVQIQCAQCHDHPTDSWKRQQFHEFAAYFAGVKRKQVTKAAAGQRAVVEVVAQGKPRYTMPDKADPQKQVFVAPKFFLDPKGTTLPEGLTAKERLGMAASYVTGQDNPWFARAFVNRIWYVLMGESFYNPVDDLGPERTPKATEVLEALASDFQKGGYDVKWLLRTIMNSQTYQREIRSTFSESSKTPFAANSPSRLRSDQIYDSLTEALALPGGRNGLAKDAAAGAAKAKGKGMNAGGARGAFNSLFGVDPSTPYDDVLGTIPQALFLMNSGQLNKSIEANPNNVLGQILIANPNNLGALNAVYLRVLARKPTPAEYKTCNRYVEMVGDRRAAFEDILWALINSTEFITRR